VEVGIDDICDVPVRINGGIEGELDKDVDDNRGSSLVVETEGAE
jgi:hypothetical protein